MKLSILLEEVEVIENSISINEDVIGLTTHSKEAMAGYVFFAISGTKANGNDYIAEVIANGGYVVTDVKLEVEIPYILVSNIREALGKMSATFYGNLYKAMTFIGIVGTNGKTTTSYIIKHIMDYVGIKTMVLGTLGCNICGEIEDYGLTSPDAIDLHRMIKKAYDRDIRMVIVEVSAHAIYYKKMYPIVCKYGIFTNISQDHLDFFGDMNNYSRCKESYFQIEQCMNCIVNMDDETGQKIIQDSTIKKITYGINTEAEFKATDIENISSGSKYNIRYGNLSIGISSKLYGYFNIYNTLAAVAVADAVGIDIEDIQKSIETLSSIDGRFNIIEGRSRIIIDFAHTPDGIENLLKAARAICSGRLIVVFGCGGNRDKSKRAIMGGIAAKLSDFIVITSDNCRFEDPFKIISDIAAGVYSCNNEDNFVCIVSREQAISYAISIGQPNDVIVICGKGAENYMDEKGIKRPYSDKKVVEEILRRSD